MSSVLTAHLSQALITVPFRHQKRQTFPYGDQQ